MAGDSLEISGDGDSLFDEEDASAELDGRGGGAGRGPAGKPASHGARPTASPPGGSGGDGSFDEADIDDLISDDDEDGGGGGGGGGRPKASPSPLLQPKQKSGAASHAAAPRAAAAAAAGAPAASARPAAIGSVNLVDDVDDDDDFDLSESGEEENPKSSPFVAAAKAPLPMPPTPPTPTPPPPAGELSAAGLATPGGGLSGGGLSETGDYSVDGDSYGSPAKTPGAESSVNFAAATNDRKGGGGSGGAAISVDNFGGGGSAAGAAARFKAMDDRRAAAGRGHAEKPPVVPKLADIEAADLDYEDEETGLELPSPLQLFLQYDTDRTGGISVHEFAQMLYDLDGLDDLHAKEDAKMNAHIAKEFDRADLNNDELISIDEFYMYFYSTLCFKFPVVRSGINPGADLLNIYMRYCSIGKSARSEQMNAYNFMKLCMQSKLVNGTSMKQAMCDIIWFRARAELESLEAWKRKGNEFITPKMLYPQFLFALMHVAEKRKSGFQEVVSRILSHNSAKPLASSADYIVYKNTGDPRQLREYVERPRGLPQLPVDNSAATKRMAREAEMAKSLGTMFQKPHAWSAMPHPPCSQSGPAPNEEIALQTTASDAAAFGEPDGLVIKPGVDGQPTTTASGRMVMGGAMPDLLTKSMFLRNPPKIESELVDTETRKKWGLEPPPVVLPRRGPAAFSHPESLLDVRALSPDVLMIELKMVFERFNVWEHGYSKSNMDKIRFHKIMRDAALMTEQVGGLTAEYVDSVFFKVLPPSQESFNFLKFVDTLRYVATKLRTSLNMIVERLVLLGGPVVNGEVHLPDGVHRAQPTQAH